MHFFLKSLTKIFLITRVFIPETENEVVLAFTVCPSVALRYVPGTIKSLLLIKCVVSQLFIKVEFAKGFFSRESVKYIPKTLWSNRAGSIIAAEMF